jgi:radical SAM protein with 4Fe4S-binding SPASM domain
MIPYRQLRASHKRVPPKGLLGLPAPFSVFVEPTNVCNFACPICPESFHDFEDRAGYYRRMSRETWARVRSELATFGKLKVLRFWGMGEPTLHADLPEWIEEGTKLSERTELATNGSRLEEMALRLVLSGLQYLRISVYSTDEDEYQVKSGSHYKLSDILRQAREFRRIRETFRSDRPWITAQLIAARPDVQAFQSQWEGIADDLVVERLHNWTGDSDGGFVQISKPSSHAPLVCSKPFSELLIKANGDVNPCCADWDGNLKLGNVNSETLLSMWNGDVLRAIRQLHLAGSRCGLKACRDCTVIDSQYDNMDGLIER